MSGRDGFQYKNLTSAGTTKLINESRPGFLKGFSVNSAYTGTLALYDTTSGTPVGTLPTSDIIIGTFGTPNMIPQMIALNAKLRFGLVAVTSGTPDVTLIYE